MMIQQKAIATNKLIFDFLFILLEISGKIVFIFETSTFDRYFPKLFIPNLLVFKNWEYF